MLLGCVWPNHTATRFIAEKGGIRKVPRADVRLSHADGKTEKYPLVATVIAILHPRMYDIYTFWTTFLGEGEKEEHMRALRCRCRRHLEAQDDRALLASLRKHLAAEHLGGSLVGSPADELATQILATRAYELEYVAVPEDNELVLEPY
jgi:hypothetical protein